MKNRNRKSELEKSTKFVLVFLAILLFFVTAFASYTVMAKRYSTVSDRPIVNTSSSKKQTLGSEDEEQSVAKSKAKAKGSTQADTESEDKEVKDASVKIKDVSKEEVKAASAESAGTSEKEDTKKKEKNQTVEAKPDSTKSSEEEKTKKTEEEAKRLLDSLTLEEKIAQMFFITPEALSGSTKATEAGSATKKGFEQYPVGGVIYFAPNLVSPDQVKRLTTGMQKISKDRLGLPVFIGIDEEGGRVTRLAGNSAFGIQNTSPMSKIGASGEVSKAKTAGENIGKYLYEYGFNLDFAPVADIITNDANSVIGNRSFGSDPGLVAEMAIGFESGLRSKKVFGVYKHFPGHGGTSQDSHHTYAYENKNLEELRETSLIPFEKAVKNGAGFIMSAHISLPNILGDSTPTTLSRKMISEVLRGDLGYDGIVITDALAMGAIAKNYTSAQASVLAIEAGCDVLLMPADFHAAYQGVLEAVCSGKISEERINASVLRIIKAKLEL